MYIYIDIFFWCHYSSIYYLLLYDFFCKFIQTLGGVMKYILITLLSFTFATQITTREFEIEIPLDSDGYQFYANIDLLDYIGIDYAQITPIEISGFSSNFGDIYFDMQIANSLGCQYQGEYVEWGVDSFGVRQHEDSQSTGA